jgi:DNA-binding transcriptional LysR family regulator
MVVCASPAYLALHGTPHVVEDLKNHNCLGYTLSSQVGPDRWRFGTDGNIVIPITGNLRAGNGDALLAAALAGQGLIYQPTFIVGEEIRRKRLVAVALDEPTIATSNVYAVYPSDRHPPAKVRGFVDFLARRFAAVPPWDRDLARASDLR